MDKQFELTILEDRDLSGVRGGWAPCNGGGGHGHRPGETNTGIGGLVGLGEIDLNVLGIAHQ